MLWNLIRDFFVQHVFGGMDSTGTYFGTRIGDCYDKDGNLNEFLNELSFKVGDNLYNYADWLSTTATAISITIIVVLCCLFVYKIIKLIGGLIR